MTHSLTIDGNAFQTQETFDVINPSTGDVVATCPLGTVSALDAAVAAARRAFPGWAARPDAERRDSLGKIADLIEAHQAELAALITAEQGKPQIGPGAPFEIGGCIAWTRVTQGLSIEPEVLIDTDRERVELIREPVGVVASITPWNWPLMIAIWHIMPVLRVGCTVVMKPSPYTPLSTLRLVQLITDADILPPGVLNAVTGAADVGDRISSHPDIDKIAFTGSTATGQRIMERAGSSLKRLTLELGGNDAGIILPGTDMNVARRLVAGTRWVNRHGVLNPTVPMGGVKKSGIGVEFGLDGMREYTTVQVLSIAK